MRSAADFLPLIQEVPHYTPEFEARWLRGEFRDEDRMLQNPLELAEYFEWFDQQHIQSYLELGIWTGHLLNLVNATFRPPLLAACDLCTFQESFGLQVRIPGECRFFRGSGHSEEYRKWREQLGHVDLTFIDADHEYDSVRRDFEVNRSFSHRFLAFHDIHHTHPSCEGSRRFWADLPGDKWEFVQPVPGAQYTMGIGVWRDTAVSISVPEQWEQPFDPASGLPKVWVGETRLAPELLAQVTSAPIGTVTVEVPQRVSQKR